MANTFLLIGAVAAFLGVALGAFGAHGLRSRLSPEMLGVFETAVRYQMYHALALLITAAVIGRVGDARLARRRGLVLPRRHRAVLRKPHPLALTRVPTLGAITPIGGLAFLAGWACLAFASF